MLAISCKLVKFVFLTLPLIILEMPARFKSFIVQIISIYFAQIT
jgi:hypothetical protein